MKKLCLTVAQYKEGEDVIKNMLSSIDTQQGVNFNDIEVLIVNDGSDVILSEPFLASFKNIKNLRYIKNEKNIGLGLTRQRGLDECDSDYIMFLDSDDLFLSAIALTTIMINLKDGLEVLYTSWLEEVRTQEGQTLYHIKNAETTWCHGKVFNVGFLNKNNICFHKDLRVHEDTYFVGVVSELSEKQLRIPDNTFLWKFMENSIVRRNNGAYIFEAMPVFLRSVELIIERLIECRSDEKKIQHKILQGLIYVFFALQSSEFAEERAAKYKIETEKKWAKMWLRFMPYINKMSKQSFNTEYNAERTRSLPIDRFENESFGVFVKRVTKA